MSAIQISGKVFRWARDRAGITNERLAKRVQAKPAILQAWESETASPNFDQARKLADALRIPMGYLVLKEPPEFEIPIADFRGAPVAGTELSPNLQDVLDDALRKRDWYAEWRQTEGLQPLGFVGRYSIGDQPSDLINDLRQALEVPAGFAAELKSWDAHFRALVQHAEQAGILVLQNGVVGHNTHRKLSLEEFRGFALASDFAPLVFINSQDTIAAKIFTLVHELVHIWSGTSGISNPDEELRDGLIDVERYCNLTAAEFLMPAHLVGEQWDPARDPAANAQRLARRFRVSAFAALVRALELDLFATAKYAAARRAIQKTTKEKRLGKGGNFKATFFTRNSRRFTTELVSAVAGGQATFVEAARLLNTKPSKVASVLENLAKGE